MFYLLYSTDIASGECMYFPFKGRPNVSRSEMTLARKSMKFPWCSATAADPANLHPDILAGVEALHALRRAKEELLILEEEENKFSRWICKS